MNRLQRTLAAFDAANSEDPNRELDQEGADGEQHPKELLYAQRMTRCLAHFCPEASEVLQLAARAQHIRRWEIPRDTYPMDRAGYKRWRGQLALFHGETAGQIMAEQGYDQTTIERVKELLLKRRLQRDAEVQTLEDVICLVFIRYYLADFASKHPRDKLVDIIRKTWNKMSPKGQQAALQLPLDSELQSLLAESLANGDEAAARPTKQA